MKYVLDKFFVFNDGFEGHAEEAAKITLYGAFSVVTTLIFWGFEVAAWSIWGTAGAKYTGAVVGLAIGYAIKFLLDRRYVFGRRTD
jgi:putative flippase GtrA